MPINATHWSVDRATGNIRYIGPDHGGSPSYATVLELHRWLQGLADDLTSSGDDELDITDLNPSSRSTDNIIALLGNYNIDDNASEHLYDGSITQGGGDTIYAGFVNFGTSASIQIIQDGAVISDDWWNSNGGLNSTTGISHRFMIKTRHEGADIDGKKIIATSRTFGQTYSEFTVSSAGEGNNVIALSESSDLNNQTAEGTVSGWTGITNTTEGYVGIDVDNNAANEFYYSEWNMNTPTRSVNDFYERGKWLTRDGSVSTLYGLNGEVFRGITHEIDYDGETGTAPTESTARAWGLFMNYDNEASGPFTVGEVLNFGTSNAVGRLLALDDNGATGSMVVSVESGTPGDNNSITGVTSGATADVQGAPTGAASGGGVVQLLAVDDNGTSGTLWVQLLKGTAPANNDRLYLTTDHTAYVDVDTNITSRNISTPFVGASTGSAIIGAYGLGIETNDLSNSDTLFDLTNTAVNPPNNVTFSVGGLVIGEDTVQVAPWDGTTTDVNGNPAFDKDQLSLSGNLTADNITSVVVAEAIPSDTPASGYIRLIDDNSFARRLSYSSWTGSTFTIDSTDGQEDFLSVNATSGNDVWISYIDVTAASATESFTSVYNTDRDLVVVVRDGGGTPIKEFISSASLGSSGGSVTAIRTTDA